jgi:hypothetical protein
MDEIDTTGMQIGLEASMRKRNKMKQGKVEKSFLNFKVQLLFVHRLIIILVQSS